MGERKKYDLSNSRIPIFTERFRKLVDKLGGVSEVSRITGITRPTINFWYNGERTPDAGNLITLSKSLGVSSDWLLGLLPDGNTTTDEILRFFSEYTGLSNVAVTSLDKLSTIHFGKKTIDTLISSPHFYEIASYLATYLYGGWVEEFTGADDGLISQLKKINDVKLFTLYIQPAMLSKITEKLIEIKKDLEGSADNGKH